MTAHGVVDLPHGPRLPTAAEHAEHHQAVPELRDTSTSRWVANPSAIPGHLWCTRCGWDYSGEQVPHGA